MLFKEIESKIKPLGRTYTEEYKLISKEGSVYGLFFDWSASGFSFKFKGTKASAQILSNRFDRAPMFAYISVDGKDNPEDCKFIEIKDNEVGEYVLCENLTDDVHTVTLRRASCMCKGQPGDGRTMAGKLALVSLNLDGEILERPEDKAIKLEFIGDSITCGDNINKLPDGRVIEDGVRTYAAYTARALDADYNVMSISGNGVIISVMGFPIFELPSRYPFVNDLGGRNEAWDFSKYQSDVVVINLGTNDRAGVPSKFSFEEFINGCDRAFDENSAVCHHPGMKDILRDAHKGCPNAKILWLFGAMGEGLTDAIKQGIREFNEEAGEEIAYFLLLQNSDEIPNGKAYDNCHPSENASKVYCQALTAEIKRILNI